MTKTLVSTVRYTCDTCGHKCVRMMRKAVNLYLGKVRINYRDMVAQNKNGDQIFLIVKEEG